ncbi:hypothetical protein BN79_115 [Yersinia phage phiR2-01]|uniref:Uncharacterized protein n=1 Tax=Yersinia phage phiR2-01 TaxID=1206557 RepID=I7LH09_9CAUD|nr:hypothetical protein BN79_115 [Yersinia phage phiR2-01]CCI88524.1 hypothetical protein BN79_115 [Yersinia phage phiR2-01]
MIKKIFKGILAGLMWFVNLVGMITIYSMFLSVMWGKGELRVPVPFTDEVKVWVWDNSSGNK